MLKYLKCSKDDDIFLIQAKVNNFHIFCVPILHNYIIIISNTHFVPKKNICLENFKHTTNSEK